MSAYLSVNFLPGEVWSRIVSDEVAAEARDVARDRNWIVTTNTEKRFRAHPSGSNRYGNYMIIEEVKDV